MAAGGIRPFRILLPLLGVGTILAGVMLFFNDQVLPEANHRLKNLIIDISQKSPTFVLRERVINEIETEDRRGAVYLQAATIDRATNELTEVVIYDLSDPSAHRTTYATSGTMAFSDNRSDLYLTLYDGDVLEAEQGRSGEFKRSEFDVQIVPLRGVGDELERREGGTVRSDREMSIALLKAEIDSRAEDLDRVRQQSLELAQRTITDALGYPQEPTEASQPESFSRSRAGSVIARGSGQRLVANTDDLTRQTALTGRQNFGRLTALQSASDQFRVEIHKKYAIAFACIVFVLVGAPLGIRFPQGGIGMVIVASVAIFAIYWAGLIGGENLANEGVVKPFWAMWAADLAFLGIGVALAARMSRTAGTNRGGGLGDVLFNLSSLGRRMATHDRKA